MPPFGDLGVTYTVHLRLVEKRVVVFLLALIDHFSLALTVEVLRADIGRNRCVRKGAVNFECKFQGVWVSPTNDFWRRKTRVPGL